MGRSRPIRCVALLRAVNVGGRGALPMALLRDICVGVGCTDVATYIQSGNVVLSSALDEPRLRRALEKSIADQAGVATEVMIRTAAEMEQVVESLPYPDAAPKHLHVGFLHQRPGTDQAQAVRDIDMQPEDATVVGRQVYLLLPDGIGRSKLPSVVARRLGGPSTTVRNWRTVTTLRDMTR
ncbi:MAG TPA: DUF1697 domain-containing protein [Acidimicrobiia bacterium]